MKLTGRDAFLKLLVDEGVTHLFGNPGTTELAIMEVLGLQDDILVDVEPDPTPHPDQLGDVDEVGTEFMQCIPPIDPNERHEPPYGLIAQQTVGAAEFQARGHRAACVDIGVV